MSSGFVRIGSSWRGFSSKPAWNLRCCLYRLRIARPDRIPINVATTENAVAPFPAAGRTMTRQGGNYHVRDFVSKIIHGTTAEVCGVRGVQNKLPGSHEQAGVTQGNHSGFCPRHTLRCRTPRDADSSKNKYSGNEIVNDWMEEEVRTSQYTRTRIIAAARSLATVLGIVRGRSALEPLRRESGTVHTLYAGRPRARSCHHLVSLEHHRGFSFLASELENFLIRRCSRRHRLFPGM
jgi:hypothetical protein